MPTPSTHRAGEAFALVHRGVLHDVRITFKAKGLMAYLLSYPVGAEVPKKAILAACSDGRDAINSAIDELVRFGYVLRTSNGAVRVLTDLPGGGTAGAENPHIDAENPHDRKAAGAENPHLEPPVEHDPVRKIRTSASEPPAEKDQVRKIRTEGGAVEHETTGAGAENPQPRAGAHDSLSSLFHEVEAKEQDGVQGKPIANDEGERARVWIFRNSPVATLEVFKSRLVKEAGLGIDVDHYFHAVLDWSNMNEGKKRSVEGWISTARTFMRGDMKKGGVKMIRTNEQRQQQSIDAAQYLREGK